jgi:hypothetical protein
MSGLFSLLVEPLGGQTDSRALKPPLLGILNHKLFEDNPDICGLYRASEKKIWVVQHEQVRTIAT